MEFSRRSSKAVLAELCSASPLSFCPGLFDAIQAAHPPAVSFFQNLPTNFKGHRAIYALVLKKPDAVPLIYIGSGTQAGVGVLPRLNQYDYVRNTTTPKNVLAAVRDDYKIVHKGLLVWSPIPSAADVPKLRLLFLAMEAAFCHLF